jgi:uncharacterized protein YciI
MQYLVAGILKPESKDKLLLLRDEFNEHLGQEASKISLFGLLRDKSGQRTGYVAIIEAASFDEAEGFLKQSPFYQNELYDRIEVAEFTPEIGNLEKA